MSEYRSHVLLALFALILPEAGVGALITLYDNGDPGGTGAAVVEDMEVPFPFRFQLSYAADDFTLNAAAEISGVQFFHFDHAIGALRYFIYTAADDVPDALVSSGAAQNLRSTSADGTRFETTFDLASPVIVRPDSYFLALGNPGPRTGPAETVYWHRSMSAPPGTARYVQSLVHSDSPVEPPGAFFTLPDPGASDLAFSIQGNWLTAVPEPSTFARFGVAILILTLLRYAQPHS